MVKFANQMSPYASPKARVLADCMFRPPKRMFVSCVLRSYEISCDDVPAEDTYVIIHTQVPKFMYM